MSKSTPSFSFEKQNLRNFLEFPLFFGRRIRTEHLALVCRSLGILLSSGVGIKKALKTAAKKTGNERCQEAMRGVYEAVTGGDDITSGMKRQGDAFPPLLIDMVHVGEQTGSLAEVLKSLASHYENLIRMRRNFRQQIAWPVFQLIAAILVIALLILILGEIAKSTGTEPLKVLPGLSGASGALLWLAINFGTIFGIVFFYRWTRHSLAGAKFLDPLLLKIPMLGHCLQSFAIARFSWAYALTQQSGMSIEPSLESSFKATSNGAFIAAKPKVWAMVSRGESLGDSLAATGLFTEDFIQIVHAAEASGTVPEMLDHLSPQFEEQARLSLKTLTTGFAWAIWALVAMFIIFLIFSVASIYIGMLSNAAKPI